MLCKKLGAGLCRLGNGGVQSCALRHRQVAPAASITQARPRPSRCRSQAPILRGWRKLHATTSRAARRVIDINMGCPAKKVCNAAAARRCSPTSLSLRASWTPVVRAVDVPVTLKIRTGSHPGAATPSRSPALPRTPAVAALTVHGRTRACAFVGSGRVRHHRRGQARGVRSGDRQRRHRHAGGRQAPSSRTRAPMRS
jgi:tRNA-dihydrouridine synthase B